MHTNQSPRRQFLMMGAAFALIPVVAACTQSDAATNASMRTALKYQDKPEGEKSCSGCMQFVPGPTETATGGCKVIPGDTEISPHGYCMVWAKKA